MKDSLLCLFFKFIHGPLKALLWASPGEKPVFWSSMDRNIKYLVLIDKEMNLKSIWSSIWLSTKLNT